MFPDADWEENACRNPMCQSYGSDCEALCVRCETNRGDTMAELIYDNEGETNDINEKGI